MADSSAQNKRREKPVLSCTFCRGRKLRCDREAPCSACIRRGKAEECLYITSEQERRVAVDYRPRARNHRAHQRLAHLEKLVTEMRDKDQRSQDTQSHASSLMDSHASREPSIAPFETPVAAKMGTLSVNDSHAVYIGSSHWVAVLEDIRKLKDEMDSEPTNTPINHEQTPLDTVSVYGQPASRITLLASATCFPREQIVAMIPPRRIVDRLVSHFFNAFDFAPLILHRSTFLAEYARFWANPSGTPIMWIGLLFSVMSMSKFLQQQDVGSSGLPDPESQDTLETYRTLTIHCLIAGDYIQPTKHTIETLTLHFATDQHVSLDTYVGNWVLIGVIVRIALRMGLHRDPSHWPTIRPLQAEMRRRIWMTLYQMDFFTSTQVGLPRLIKDSQCDTNAPLHLLEHDILPEHDQMPKERPSSEPTPLLYLIQRFRLIKGTAGIYDATEGGPILPATAIALGDDLQSTINAIPPCLRYQSAEASVADDPVIILQRMLLDILINKAIYLLHRQSFMRETSEDGHGDSNMRCIDAALTILDHQRRISEEVQPGGILYNIRWKATTSLNHEFLQATMMLCFVLSRSNESERTIASSSTLHRRQDILNTLKRVKDVWEKDASESLEARRAAEAVAVVLSDDISLLNAPRPSASYSAFSTMPEPIVPGYLGTFDIESIMALDHSIDTGFPSFDAYSE